MNIPNWLSIGLWIIYGLWSFMVIYSFVTGVMHNSNRTLVALYGEKVLTAAGARALFLWIASLIILICYLIFH